LPAGNLRRPTDPVAAPPGKTATVDEQVATQRTPSAPGRHDLSRPWAARPDDVRRALGSSEHGLSDDEARRRLRRFGLNRLEHEAATPWWVLAARQFRSPLIYMLIAAAAVTVALGEHLDAALIAGVLLVNALLGYVQEHRAERSLDALRRPRARARTCCATGVSARSTRRSSSPATSC
jgi:cation-transporting ATPase F